MDHDSLELLVVLKGCSKECNGCPIGSLQDIVPFLHGILLREGRLCLQPLREQMSHESRLHKCGMILATCVVVGRNDTIEDGQ